MAVKLKKCVMPGTSNSFLREQLGELDYDFNAEFDQASEEEKEAFYKFANAFGCFSRQKYIDENGKETPMVLGQKASTVLRKLMTDDRTQELHMKNARLRIGDFAELFSNLPENTNPNPNFVNFVGHALNEYGIVQYPNLELLLNMERGYEYYNEADDITAYSEPMPGLFSKTLTHFDLAQNLMTKLNEDHLPENLKREDALRRFYNYSLNKTYHCVRDEYRDMADLFLRHGIDESIYSCACGIFDVAEKSKAPHHILPGKPLQDTTADLDFRFEMLDKRDPRNAILGIYCSCCAIVGSPLYGGHIAERAILASDVQNMVIRNGRNEIIAKGTVYINFEKGEALFNDFEVNHRYTSESNRKQGIQRKQIFSAFERGIKALVTRYDELHPEHPIQIVNVGLGNNKLKDQCWNFPFAHPTEAVYTEYNFRDAKDAQFVLYQRPREKTMEAGQVR